MDWIIFQHIVVICFPKVNFVLSSVENLLIIGGLTLVDVEKKQMS